jgi:hypothetical protein
LNYFLSIPFISQELFLPFSAIKELLLFQTTYSSPARNGCGAMDAAVQNNWTVFF